MRQLKKYIYFNGSGWREDFCPTKHRQLTKGSEEGAVALDKVPISTQNSRNPPQLPPPQTLQRRSLITQPLPPVSATETRKTPSLAHLASSCAEK